ncbi:hypothetical protein CAP48_00760 [Advenella sp. S44]|nr:hypothetical protein CAP48_00760 [Advenella sp. S44]
MTMPSDRTPLPAGPSDKEASVHTHRFARLLLSDQAWLLGEINDDMATEINSVMALWNNFEIERAIQRQCQRAVPR